MRLQLQTAIVAPLVKGPTYFFRVGYDKPAPGGGTLRIHPKNAPTISLKKGGGIVQTSNLTAQKYLLNHLVPQNTKRGLGNAPPGRRPAGFIFQDVTATTTAADIDVDLEQILV